MEEFVKLIRKAKNLKFPTFKYKFLLQKKILKFQEAKSKNELHDLKEDKKLYIEH